MTEAKRLLKVFLSYASQDKPVVRELYQRLKLEGWIDLWLDKKKLLPGQDWRSEIEDAIEVSDLVIICLSTNSVSKNGFVQKELRYAREIAFEKPEETIFLVPLRLDDCDVPRGLRFYQWGDYFGERTEETYTALLEALKLRYEQKLKIEDEIARREKERQEHESAEKIAREKEERELAIKAARDRERNEIKEKLAREAAEKVAREKAERDVAEKIAQEKAKREAMEKVKRERAERRAFQIVELKKFLSKPFSSFRFNTPKVIPSLRVVVSFAGIAIVLLWLGPWGFSKLASLMPTASPTATVTFTPTNTKHPTATKTLIPTSTIAKTPTNTATETSTGTPTETQTKAPTGTPTLTQTPLPKVDANIKPDRPDFPIGVPLTFRSEMSTLTYPDGTKTYCHDAKDCTYEWYVSEVWGNAPETNPIFVFAFKEPRNYHLFLKVCYGENNCDTDTLSIDVQR